MMAPCILPPAQRLGCRPTWQMDTNFQR